MRVRVGDCLFDSATRELTRLGEVLAVSPKAFDLLGLLLERRPEAVSRVELHERLWPDTFVSRTSLAQLINELRGLLGDDARQPTLIRTVHRFGYAFCGEALDEERPGAQPLAGRTGFSLVWGEREIALLEGENILGRDSQAVVRFRTPKASRRHARILVAGDRALLEDLGSKNGTFLDGKKIDEPTQLVNGSEIGIGSEILILCSAPGGSTETAGQE